MSIAKEQRKLATILVVDDDLSLLARLGTTLEQEGYEVFKVSAVQLAATVFEQHNPDLVILEVKTGQDAGWSLLESFANRKPVMVLSAYGREEDVIRGLEGGAIDYITKPYRTAELLTRIRKRLNGVVAGHPSPRLDPTSFPLPDPTSFPLPDPASSTTAPGAEDGREEDTLERNRSGMGANGNSAPLAKYEPNASTIVSENEEMALLRSVVTIQSPEEETETLEEYASLGRMLHLARRKRRITLVQAENTLNISMAYLQAMEEERFSFLPQSPLAVQMVRSYATYLGLDPQQAVKSFEQSYPMRPIEHKFSKELSRYRTRSPLPVSRWILWTIAVVLATVVGGWGIAWLDPTGAKTLGHRLNQLVSGVPPLPPATETPTPTWTVTPTDIPPSTPTQTPQPTSTPTVAMSIPVSPTHRFSPTLFISPTGRITPTDAISSSLEMTAPREPRQLPALPNRSGAVGGTSQLFRRAPSILGQQEFSL